MTKKEPGKKVSLQKKTHKEPCYHPYMKAGKSIGEKICVSCGRTIYKVQDQLSKYPEESSN